MLPSTAITRLDLSSTFSEFDLAMSRKDFIGPRVFRPRMVAIQAADVGKIPIEAILRTGSDTRAPGGSYKGDDFEFTKFPYSCKEHGRKAPIDDAQLAIFRDMLDAEAIQSQRAIDQVLRNYEIDCAAATYDTAVWTGATLTTAITNEWDDATNAVPIKDVQAARLKVRAVSGLKVNALICNAAQLWNLANTDQVVDRIKYWGGDDPKKINAAMIAALLDLDFILVAGGFKNASKEGQAFSGADIWSDEYAMVARVAVTDDPQEPCVGRTFLWSEDGPGAPGSDEELAVIVEEYRNEEVRGSVVRARNNRDIVVMYPEAGHLLSNVTTI
jgi:hypothetical protein